MRFDNAMVWAGAQAHPRRASLRLDGERIAAIAADGAEPDGGGRDLSGCHIVPGFVDAHSHLTVSAWIPEWLDGSGWRDADAALAALRQLATARPGAPWLIAMQVDFDGWRGGVPAQSRLDDAVGGRPAIVMDGSLHRCWVSSAALAASGAATLAPRIADDIERRRGRPTGLLWEAVSAMVFQRALADLAAQLGDGGYDALLRAEAERHLSLGITACHDPLVPPSMQDAMQRLRRATPLRLSWSRVAEASLLQAAEAAELCPECGEGPASAKLFMDGAHKCALCLDPAHVMAMAGGAVAQACRGHTSPLRDLLRYRTVYRDRRFYMPYLRMDGDALKQRLDTLSQHAVRPKIHALGNHAVACSCAALKQAGIRDATLEHLVVLGDAELDAVADCGAVASLQTGFIEHYGAALIARRTMPRLRVLPAASLQARGVPLALSSDNPCGPLDPLFNIRAAVERRLPDGRVVDAREAIAPEAAIAAYSVGGYRAIHGHEAPGLTAGAPADFVILSGDPLDARTTVRETWIGGRRAWPPV
ncbi:amidohydrolase family protein [Solimonas variicoloris]|uniref:amidohydrolase family protein n=1 Tax=Solimonas variicoloris TaxID=254408 RepID=UPI000360EAC8|nr:amidohydrolase family protein [Solimonas variicoloris]